MRQLSGKMELSRFIENEESLRIRIQTILNQVEKFKSFVYGEACIEKCKQGLALVVDMMPRKSARLFCSGFGRVGQVYDRLADATWTVCFWDVLSSR